jgi:hypothetical protein
VLTRSQARTAGLSDRIIDGLLTRGHWQRLHRGVYAAFSGPPPARALMRAALLRAGPAAVLSHQTAALLWSLMLPPDRADGDSRSGSAYSGLTTPIHLTVSSGSPARPTAGVIVHYSGRLARARHPALDPPRTRLEETVLDLAAAALSADDAVSWLLQACGSRRTTPGRLAAALGERGRMRWRREVERALDPANSGVHSPLEYRYVRYVERPHGLPAGTRQRLHLDGGSRRQYADVEYDGYATIVELDGRAAHPESSRLTDARRDNANLVDGRVTLRYGWADVSEHGCEVAAQVAATLRQRGWGGRLRSCGPGCRAGAVIPCHNSAS